MRATRRHHLRRMKAKARRLYPGNTQPEKLANHLCCCSCHLCTYNDNPPSPRERAALAATTSDNQWATR